jgi:hypothetical protein
MEAPKSSLATDLSYLLAQAKGWYPATDAAYIQTTLLASALSLLF